MVISDKRFHGWRIAKERRLFTKHPFILLEFTQCECIAYFLKKITSKCQIFLTSVSQNSIKEMGSLA